MTTKQTIDFRVLEEVESDLEYAIKKDELDTFFENSVSKPLEGVLLFLGGSAGTWQGNKEYENEILSLEDFENRRTKDGFPVYEITYNKDKIKKVEVLVAHHDGVNHYTLTPLEFVKKEDLKNFLLNNEDREDLNEVLKEGWFETISTASKQDLVSYIDFNY